MAVHGKERYARYLANKKPTPGDIYWHMWRIEFFKEGASSLILAADDEATARTFMSQQFRKFVHQFPTIYTRAEVTRRGEVVASIDQESLKS